MLDAFGEELEAFSGHDITFRSYVLTPVLQRQLQGVPDCYAPAIYTALVEESDEVTISDATKFYLGIDPVDPIYITSYRRNIVYIREARWHLAILMGKCRVGNRELYSEFIDDHDYIMKALRETVEGVNMDENVCPLLSKMEVEALVFEGIDRLFKAELKLVVCAPNPFKRMC